MKTINMHEAKTHLSRIVDDVAVGEPVLIAKAGKPVAILSALPDTAAMRTPGKMKGKIAISDDFDADDSDVTALFLGEGS